MQKRGLSTIVASVLLILLVIVAIGIIWTILKPSLTKSAEEIDSSLLTVNMKIEKATIAGNLTSVRISRQAGEGQVDKIRVIIENETSSDVKEVSGLEELESRTYSIETSITNASKIAVVPVMIKDGEDKLGMKSDEYIPRKTTTEVLEIPQPLTCPTGLVSYWKFDEGTGVVASDSKEINNGNIIGGVSWTSAKLGQGLSFNGNGGNYVHCGNTNLNMGNLFSLSLWIYPEAVGSSIGRDIITKQIGPSQPWSSWGLDFREDNSVGFWTGESDNGYSITKTPAFQLNTWYYIVAVYNSTYKKIYVNGALVSSIPYTKSIKYSNDNCIIGTYTYDPITGNSFKGKIDNVAIYNRALTQAEISDYYNSGSGKEIC